ncbi:MAG TPA: ATP synthase subunit I [Thermoanaerobaculia bacterium]|nr:ATP synthase subunit I [Thermoanaerobaculia bacterium]
MDPDPLAHDEPAQAVLRRVRLMSAFGYAGFAVFTLISSGFHAFVGLTCSAAVVMINFLWLEEIVSNLLQPTPHPHPWRLTLRAVARFALLGVALVVTIYVARFNPLSVLLGFSIVVVGIMGEALYSVYRSFTGQV